MNASGLIPRGKKFMKASHTSKNHDLNMIIPLNKWRLQWKKFRSAVTLIRDRIVIFTKSVSLTLFGPARRFSRIDCDYHETVTKTSV